MSLYSSVLSGFLGLAANIEVFCEAWDVGGWEEMCVDGGGVEGERKKSFSLGSATASQMGLFSNL